MQLFFTRLFVSERKQIALMADEKLHSQFSHRLFATSRSEMESIMKKGIVIFALCMCVVFTCFGCEKKTEKQTEEQTAGEDGMVSMSATLTDDSSTTIVYTIFNKTENDIVIGEEVTLQVLKDKSFVDVPLLDGDRAYNLLAINISSGEEYSDRVPLEDSYGDLEAGRYRIVKEYANKEQDGQKKENASKETVSAEFDLP